MIYGDRAPKGQNNFNILEVSSTEDAEKSLGVSAVSAFSAVNQGEVGWRRIYEIDY